MGEEQEASSWGKTLQCETAESCVFLNNGVEMPRIGYGVYQIPPRMTERCVAEALHVGYRSIDTAQCYGNEAEVGHAVRASGVPRDEVFVTTKLWGARAYRDAAASIERSCRTLGLGYIDLLLIHEPTGNYREVWRAMEDALTAGAVRAIGVANFLEEAYLDVLHGCRVVPAVNQVEMHVFRQQEHLRALMRQHGTQPESWSPLACAEHDIFRNPMLARIAQAHGRTVAQVALRFLYQQDIVVIPKTVHVERMRENRTITDFALTDIEMDGIRALDEGRSLFNWW